MNRKLTIVGALLLSTGLLAAAGCQQEPEDKMESAKESMSDAVDSVGDAVESTGEAIEQKAEEAQ
ncbi:hypothetical protein [Halopseudomonas maritima]|uniref:hypothetical protein n=1 Tax=Halopseudomonas maritima TaxID=2918528 RepID=UPI001EEA60A8|nr:hypothetical protein [Halopseudomonas maritima]UJJ31734.1 hypothetical protein HV822_00670 [Halopseudomonas maritima]